MRLLHLITDLHVGGAEVMLLRLVEGLQGFGIESRVVALTGGGPLAPELRRLGVATTELGLGRGRLPALAALRLRRLARDWRADLVQGWMYHGNLAASFVRATARRRLPVVWGIHATLAQDPAIKPLTRAVIRLGARPSRATAAVVYCSATSARQHERIGYAAARSLVIPNGTDCERFRPDPEARARLGNRLGLAADVTVVGMLARHDPMKDHDNLLRATRHALDLGSRLHLVLAGEGVDDANAGLLEAIAAAGLLPHVTLLGRRGDIDRLVPGLDVLALPSAYGEAFPLVLGEAMACAVPCVATDLGDCAAILGDTGLVVPPREPTALAAALRQLAGLGRVGRAALGARARERVLERFALSMITRRYADLYLGLREDQRRDIHMRAGEHVMPCAD
jgi:glycosyltransferase involved in cell wall biosynthesis